jgi:hypothetical protein
MQSVTVSEAMDEIPNLHLRLGIFSADERHSFAALFLREGIRHVSEMPASGGESIPTVRHSRLAKAGCVRSGSTLRIGNRDSA